MPALRSALAGLSLLVVAGRAGADVAPIIPGTKGANARHRILAAEAFPDHVFLLVQNGPTCSIEEVRPAPGWELLLTPESRVGDMVLIVPAAAAQEHPSLDALAEAVLAGRVPGATWTRFFPWETAPIWSAGDIVVTYQVRRTGRGEELEVVRTSTDPMAQYWVVAILVPAAVMFGGLWLTRRRLRRQAASPPT